MTNSTESPAVLGQLERQVRRQCAGGECKCTFTQYMVGDGCSVCNPAKALEYASHTVADLQAHRDMLDTGLREAIGVIEELCTAHKHPEPEASMTRMQKALDFDA